MFEANEVIRRRNIHRQYGGQAQGGISTPKSLSAVILFTGGQGATHGYSDGWLEDDSLFLYTGEGQHGDMSMQRGNRAIQNHAANGKALYLFEYVSRGKVQFIGEMVCVGWYWDTRPDTEGLLRRAIVFQLRPASALDVELNANTDEAFTEPSSGDLAQLRRKATASSASVRTIQERTQHFRDRSRAVKAYALARANGVCECCAQPAPFFTTSGRPFLEVHHILSLADEGPDDPEHVAALCPNCHRMTHHSSEHKELGVALLARIAEIERGAVGT